MRKAAVSVALISLCACGGGGGSTPTTPTKTPSTVVVGPSTAGLIKVGDDQVYTATVNWSDGSQTTETATWTSDNSSVATIDGTGKAHGVGSGEASLVGSTPHGTGVLKIRVVPNYQGTWTGDYTVRGCSATGAFTPNDWCGDVPFKVGTLLPITVAFTQNLDRLSGTITLGQIATALDATSSIAVDGGANMSAQGTFTDSSVNFTVTLNPVNFRANGPTMTGTFTQTITAAGYAGSVTVGSDLNSIPRTSTLMGIELPSRRFSSPADFLRAFLQK